MADHQREKSASEARREDRDGAVKRAAGCILYCRQDTSAAPQFLLLKNANHKTWGFPKGHVDPDDVDLLATAVRELEEETGLADVLVHSGFRQSVDYPLADGRGQKHVTYFLARLERGSVQTSQEHEQMCWAADAEAKRLLAYPEMAALIDAARYYLEGAL